MSARTWIVAFYCDRPEWAGWLEDAVREYPWIVAETLEGKPVGTSVMDAGGYVRLQVGDPDAD